MTTRKMFRGGLGKERKIEGRIEPIEKLGAKRRQKRETEKRDLEAARVPD